jgi:putative transposase
MANTFYQVTLQVIFAVRSREALLEDSFRIHLHKYITGIVKNNNQKLLCINSMPDHIHILLGVAPSMRVSDLVRDIKSSSASYINENKLSRRKFYWQNGYGVFSYSMSHRKRVIAYIENQQRHHDKLAFRDEYLRFLESFNIKYNQKYLFEFFDD